MSTKKVVIGMSGGVDSTVAALLLKEQGYDVIGLFMRNWHEKDECGHCTAEEDFTDVRRVSASIGIPYYAIDLSKEYQDEVFSLFLKEYEKGRTPNPDVLCNKQIKFGHFKKYAETLGADYIATGHYAGVLNENEKTYLIRSLDENKDQTYFLNQLSEQQLQNVIFPLTNMLKPEVRKIAEKYKLATAAKKDSTGVCFIGERNFRNFLSSYIPMKEGIIKTLDGKVVGKHQGVFYYTIGQRKGLGVGGAGEPWFVVKKDVKENILYISHGETAELFSDTLVAKEFNYITEKPENGESVLARIRHRQPLEKATYYCNEKGEVQIKFDRPIRAITPGQYVVIYNDRVCIGGGLIR